MYVLFALLIGTTFSDVEWRTNYSEAMAAGKREGRFVLIQFGEPANTFRRARVSEKLLEDYVFVRLALDSSLDRDGKKVRLLDHPAFEHLMGKPGIVVIDYKNAGPNYGRVVTAIPAEQLTTLTRVLAVFQLPPGSLSQRTLIWALRVHPEAPKSTAGQPHPELVRHAEQHSRAQARSNDQYHNLPGFATGEIVAESWPWSQDVVSAALDIVHAWSQSPGHWSAATRYHPFFGYDMVTNGRKWFATGVFIH